VQPIGPDWTTKSYIPSDRTSTGQDLEASLHGQSRRFFARALNAARRPTEVTTDRAPAYPRVLDELIPEACYVVEQYANNPIEADHGQLKAARTRPMAA
jgi:transposase-like protein